MLANRLSQKELSSQAGIHQSILSNFLLKRRGLSLTSYLKLKDCIGNTE